MDCVRRATDRVHSNFMRQDTIDTPLFVRLTHVPASSANHALRLAHPTATTFVLSAHVSCTHALVATASHLHSFQGTQARLPIRVYVWVYTCI